jgi:hypothetical protein
MKLLTFIGKKPHAKPTIGAWLDGDIVDPEAAGALANRGHDAFRDSLRSDQG